MSNFLSQLTTSERARLLEELNYMNLEEIRGFCSERAIPYRIVAESANGKVKATKDTDRKPIVLARVRRYLRTGQVGQPTRIPAQIVREENPPARLGPRDRLYYRWYAKEFEGVMRLLRDLTAGRFRDGAVARVLAMEFWTRGEAPDVRGVRPVMDESQGRGAPAAHAGVRLPDRPPPPARRRRLEGLAQGQGEVRSGDACGDALPDLRNEFGRDRPHRGRGGHGDGACDLQIAADDHERAKDIVPPAILAALDGAPHIYLEFPDKDHEFWIRRGAAQMEKVFLFFSLDSKQTTVLPQK